MINLNVNCIIFPTLKVILKYKKHPSIVTIRNKHKKQLYLFGSGERSNKKENFEPRCKEGVPKLRFPNENCEEEP